MLKSSCNPAYALGIDIGGTKCAVILGACSREGEGASVEGEKPQVLARREIATIKDGGYESTLNRLYEEADAVLSAQGASAKELCGIGISCGGPLDSKTGYILSPPNLPGWDEVPVTKLVRERFDVPCALQNDANACALAEWRWGAARGTEHAVFLTFGTGMGAGLILNGALYEGASGLAGEVGHLRLAETGPVGFGKAGSFEGFCSGGGIVEILKTLLLEEWQQGHRPAVCPDREGLSDLSTKKAAQFAAEGDALCLEAFRISAARLGQGLSLLIDVLNPEVIVIGSVYARARELFEDTMRKVIREEALAASRDACRIVPAELGDAIGDYAALSVAYTGNSV